MLQEDSKAYILWIKINGILPRVEEFVIYRVKIKGCFLLHINIFIYLRQKI